MKRICTGIIFLLLGMQPLSAFAEGFAIFADLLAWQASEETAATWSTIVRESSPNTVDMNATNIGFDWDLGFRGGAAYESADNFWDSELFWTYFASKTSSNFNVGRQIVLPEFFSGFVSGNIFFGANINWRLTMNTVDLKVGHKFKPSNSFSLRPAIGLKTGTIYQTISTDWYADIYTSTETVKNNFFGIGPSFSLDSNWNVYKNFSIFANISTAFLWGHWTLNDTYARPSAALGLVTPTRITTTMNQTQLGTIMFDYILGLEWTHKGRSNVTFQLGYEMQFWANQLRFTTFQQLPVHGDLTLQGGTCRIRVDL